MSSRHSLQQTIKVFDPTLPTSNEILIHRVPKGESQMMPESKCDVLQENVTSSAPTRSFNS